MDRFIVDMSMHAEHRARLAARMRADQFVPPGSCMLLQGGSNPERNDSDHEPVFRQESNFNYVFGVKEPDCFGVVDIDDGTSTLFVPRLPEDYAIWMGEVRGTDSFKQEYQVDAVKYTDELMAHLTEKDPKVVYTMRGKNADSGSFAVEASFDGIENFRVDNGKLFPELIECRVIKSDKELALMRHVNKLSSQAHIAAMARCQAGMGEFQLESIFRHWAYFTGGARHASYTSICGSGPNSATLHYGHGGAPNSKTIGPADMMLMDLGAEYHCYTSDITCSYPASGVFSAEQREVYNIVLAASHAVLEAIKPGVSYVDMHTLSYKVICEGLLRVGVLQGTLEACMEANMGAVFMPHGLGHLMGLDTHDVGGRPKGTKRLTKPGYKSLRLVRELEVNMVLTVEPGLYFNPYCLRTALHNPKQAPLFNKSTLSQYQGEHKAWGVRIEDDVIVTCLLYTSPSPRDRTRSRMPSSA
eukprot:TRINITY_DN19714_c0_g1_i2.p1 TRINITY_DN19714_c0_g1~~TRINITY_DN19714_c0_g1_i2.p1  ORF type:complete len:471 (+),score=132.32 TRINITY_DN19714_c0_g1_i2:182-1594(+)